MFALRSLLEAKGDFPEPLHEEVVQISTPHARVADRASHPAQSLFGFSCQCLQS